MPLFPIQQAYQWGFHCLFMRMHVYFGPFQPINPLLCRVSPTRKNIGICIITVLSQGGLPPLKWISQKWSSLFPLSLRRPPLCPHQHLLNSASGLLWSKSDSLRPVWNRGAIPEHFNGRHSHFLLYRLIFVSQPQRGHTNHQNVQTCFHPSCWGIIHRHDVIPRTWTL